MAGKSFLCGSCHRSFEVAACAENPVACPHCQKPVSIPLAGPPSGSTRPNSPVAGLGTASVVAPKPGYATRLLLAQPKPMLFGLCGAIGGLVWALVLGELLWALLSPRTIGEPTPELKLAVPSKLRVYVGGSNRFQTIIARENLKCPVLLKPVQLPDGIAISPVTFDEGDTEAEIEVTAVPSLAPGAYMLSFSAQSTTGPEVRSNVGNLSLRIEQPPPSISLSVPPKVSLFQGGEGKFTVRVARSNFTDAIKLDFEGVPSGIELPVSACAEGIDEVVITARAGADQDVGSTTIIARASAAPLREVVKEESRFTLEVLPATPPKADILFVLDLTGSMNFAIEGIKSGIQNFAGELAKRSIDANVGMICFRDLDKRERPFVLDVAGGTFTKNFDEFRSQVATLRAFGGGGDGPESSLQALALATKQAFRPATAKVLILITDAPPKIHPRETPSTVQQTVEILLRDKIDQVHLVVRDDDLQKDFKPFQDAFKGSFFDIKLVARDRSFAGILPQLGSAISALTTTALPPAPVAITPTPLPATSAAPPPPSERPEILKGVQSTQIYKADDSFRLLLAICGWSMVTAAGISFVILSGQEFYARQTWIGVSAASRSLAGGLLAGLAGGAIGQLVFQTTAGGAAWEWISRVLGWSLLGALVGGGLAFCIPNLKATRGLLGGVVGGAFGAVGFQLISILFGALLGRLVGAGTLGFCIGLMVALAEQLFRQAWLEVDYGGGERRTVNLGPDAVRLGSDSRRSTVCVVGAEPVAFRYWMRQGRVTREEVSTGQATEMLVGQSHRVGAALVTVRGLIRSGASRPISAALSPPPPPSRALSTSPVAVTRTTSVPTTLSSASQSHEEKVIVPPTGSAPDSSVAVSEARPSASLIDANKPQTPARKLPPPPPPRKIKST